MSIELRRAIDELLNCGIVNRHSYFQLKYFVVGKEPTVQSKMWRCIKELETRRESLNAMDLEIVEIKDNIELVDIELERLEKREFNESAFGISLEPWEAELHKKEASICIRKKERQKRALQDSLKKMSQKQRETEEEATFFLKAFESLKKIETLKPFDDLQEQTKYWNEKLTQLANLKVLLHLPLDTELVQTILSLSDDCEIKNEMVKLLETQRNNNGIGNEFVHSTIGK